MSIVARPECVANLLSIEATILEESCLSHALRVFLRRRRAESLAPRLPCPSAPVELVVLQGPVGQLAPDTALAQLVANSDGALSPLGPLGDELLGESLVGEEIFGLERVEGLAHHGVLMAPGQKLALELDARMLAAG
jgi:hypothetical protein